MKKSTMDLLMAFALINGDEFGSLYNYDLKVSECLTDMYFYMLYNGIDNDVKKEEYFHEFEKKYDKLNKEQQEMVKDEYINIIESQKKNREKIKRKERNE